MSTEREIRIGAISARRLASMLARHGAFGEKQEEPHD